MGVDLVDFYRDKISLRKLCLYAWYLTDDSLVKHEMQNRENFGEGVWNTQEQLLANIYNLMAILRYYAEHEAWSNQRKPSPAEKPMPPIPLHPPGWRKPKAVMSPVEDVVALFGGAIYSTT